jgi:hypothetical protein
MGIAKNLHVGGDLTLSTGSTATFDEISAADGSTLFVNDYLDVRAPIRTLNDSVECKRLKFAGYSSDPALPGDGAIWYNTTANELRTYSGTTYYRIDRTPV